MVGLISDIILLSVKMVMFMKGEVGLKLEHIHQVDFKDTLNTINTFFPSILAYNSDSIGICVIGSFMNSVPNTLATNAVKDLIQCGVDRGTIKRTYSLKGHRDGTATSCPGDAFYNLIKSWTNFGK
jgi:hypothetical protein